ncbi:MAG: hypothetical protein HQ483_06080 [Rhodospirillales bacterium]|nr:hypothetical protein [Rhodospirillales bacterium]
MNTTGKLLICAGFASLITAGCTPNVQLSGGHVVAVDATPVEDYDGSRILSLDKRWRVVSQGWNEDVRRAFWFTPQGALMMPYDWFLHLETADGTTKFSSPENMERLGYLTARSETPENVNDIWNPDGLPIGFARTPTLAGDFVGPTCAACHTNLMIAGDMALLIDGAPALSNFKTLNEEVVLAMAETRVNDARFNRFADAVYAKDPDYAGNKAAMRQKLKSEFTLHLGSMEIRNDWNYSGLTEKQDYGFGRLDAIGAILNQVSATDAGKSANSYHADAPVSYPFLWGVSQSDVVQWNGVAPNQNLGFGPLARNVGEVIGVYGQINFEPTSEAEEKYLKNSRNNRNLLNRAAGGSTLGFGSSILMDNLGTLETWLKHLKSPKWPADILPFDDQLPPLNDVNENCRTHACMAEEGRKIFMGETKAQTGVACVECHHWVAREEQSDGYHTTMVPVSEIGTDPKMAGNYLLKSTPKTGKPWASGRLEGTRSLVLIGKKYGANLETRGDALVTFGAGSILGQFWNSVKAAFLSLSDSEKAEEFDPDSYKARPLDGIWATAPYLHNGSVPNLTELLKHERDRIKAFSVGSRRFDPVNVGYDTQPGPNTTVLDTSVPGNLNTGHSGQKQGVLLSSEQKKHLIEFLKTL